MAAPQRLQTSIPQWRRRLFILIRHTTRIDYIDGIDKHTPSFTSRRIKVKTNHAMYNVVTKMNFAHYVSAWKSDMSPCFLCRMGLAILADTSGLDRRHEIFSKTIGASARSTKWPRMCEIVYRAYSTGYKGGSLRVGQRHAHQCFCITHTACRLDWRAILLPPDTTGIPDIPCHEQASCKAPYRLYPYTCTCSVRRRSPFGSRYSLIYLVEILAGVFLPVSGCCLSS